MESATPPTESPDSQGLKRSLGLLSLTVYGIGNMLGAGVYGLIGKVAEVMGNAMWMAFAASMVAAALTGLSYACLGSRYPRAAGAAYITQRAFGFPLLSYAIGLAVMCSGLTSMATASRVFSEYLLSLLGADLPWRWLAIPLFVGMLAAVNFRGLRESAWLNAVCTAIESAGLLLIIAVGLRYWGSVDYFDATSLKNPAGELALSMVLSGSVLTFYAFIGFEDLLNISEEVKDAQRTFPIALVAALIVTALIYMGVSISAVSVAGHQALAASKQPMVEVVRAGAPWFPPVLFSIIAMFAVTNTALLNFIMGSRLAYGMARQGLLPRFFGALHPTRRTPHRAIAILGCIVLALALSGDIKTLASATSLLLLACFSVVNGALIVLKLRPGEPRGGFEVPVAVPLGGIAVCVALMSNAALKPLLIAAGIIAGILILYAILRPRAIPE